jgi:hypothetical protein
MTLDDQPFGIAANGLCFGIGPVPPVEIELSS